MHILIKKLKKYCSHQNYHPGRLNLVFVLPLVTRDLCKIECKKILVWV